MVIDSHTGAAGPVRRMSRRDVLKGGLLGGIAVAGGLPMLAACGGSSEKNTSSPAAGSSTPGGSLGNAALQLLWLENVQFAGSYIAETRGYYKAAGVEVTLLPGGVTITPEPVVVAGKALVGISSPSLTGTAVNQGADLKIIGAGYQRNPVVLISLGQKAITTPADCAGKRVGVQANIATVWDAFVKVNNLGGKVTTVPVQSDPSPLASGEIDGYVGFVTNEAVTLKVRGLDVRTLAFQDFGLPTLYETYVVQAGSLQDAKKRQQIKAVMTGEIRGWQDQVANPGTGVDLALNDFGKSLGLNRDQQTAQATGQNPLIVSADTDQHGLFWMTEAAISQSVQTAASAGTPLKSALFTNEILAEIYAGRNRL